MEKRKTGENLNRPDEVLKIYDEELKAYDKAIEINPYDTKAWHNKGIILIELKH